jgi:IS605 OrfB family transposase
VVNPLTLSYKVDGDWKTKVILKKAKGKLDHLERQRKKQAKKVSKKQLSYNKRCKKVKPDKYGEIIKPSRSNLDKAILKLQKCYLNEKNFRKELANKVSNYLANNFERIKFEDVQISKMTRAVKKTKDGSPRKNVAAKSGLNREMLRLGFSNIVSLTEWKALNLGGRVERVNPKYTSQRCSCCKEVNKESRISRDRYHCVSCGFKLDADENAARNIYARKAA